MTITDIKAVERDARVEHKYQMHVAVRRGPFPGRKPPQYVVDMWPEDPPVCGANPLRMCAARYVALTRVGAGMCCVCGSIEDPGDFSDGASMCSVCGAAAVCGIDEAASVGKVVVQ